MNDINRSTDELHVGDIAIGQAFLLSVERNGMECEIIAPLQMKTTLCYPLPAELSAMQYAVRWADGIVSWQEPHNLKKKGQLWQCQELGEWELCPWQPTEVPA